LGLFVVKGLSLGPIEVVSLSLIIGLSVDYSLHLGHAYMHSIAHHRKERTQHAVVSMGSSLIAASLSTIGSMLVLLLCTIQLFVTIGTIISLTMTVALLLSLGTFAAWLSVMGPEGDFGNVSSVVQCQSCRKKLREKFPGRYEMEQEEVEMGELEELEKAKKEEAELILPFDLFNNKNEIDEEEAESEEDEEEMAHQRFFTARENLEDLNILARKTAARKRSKSRNKHSPSLSNSRHLSKHRRQNSSSLVNSPSMSVNSVKSRHQRQDSGSLVSPSYSSKSKGADPGEGEG
jgi:hypothetical protein